jgi:hypothetical protein
MSSFCGVTVQALPDSPGKRVTVPGRKPVGGGQAGRVGSIPRSDIPCAPVNDPA